VETQFSIVTSVADVESLQCAESVAHEGIDPLSEWGAGLEKRSHGFAELASGDVVTKSDI
jgi:hypothetical protein